MAHNAHLSERDPDWAAVEHLYPMGMIINSPLEFREYIMAIRARIDAAEEKVTQGLDVIEAHIPVEDGEILVKAFVPHALEGESDGFPLLQYIYGGGWILGSIDNEEALLRRLAVSSRITCVCGDQRKAPEHPYPTPLNDCQAVLKWALNNTPKLSINKSKGVIVGGMSSGANLATVLAHRGLKDPELRNVISGQLMSVPTVISPHAYFAAGKLKPDLLSVDKDEDGRFLTKQQLQAYNEAYHGKDKTSNPEVSPLLADSFAGLPPAYIQVAGRDILRDEGLLYERLLREAGVSTRLDVYPGCPHAFYVSSDHWQATKKQKKDFAAGLDWLLRRTENRD